MKNPLELLYPPRCILCGCVLPGGGELCPACRKQAPIFKNSKTKLQFLDSFTAVWYYKENVRYSLLRFKFRGGVWLAEPYGRFLAERIRETCPQLPQVLTWVPTSFLRRMRRGYDQSRLIAEAVGRELGLTPVRLLKKIRNNPAQSGLSDAAQRRGNVIGVYRVCCPELTQGRRILLIDDILTTGATAGECARMLKTAGATEVHCAVVAAALKKS